MGIVYHKGDLFELAPKDAYLAHACNCQATWGSGIALQFKEKFPDAFEEYKDLCSRFAPEVIEGMSYVCVNNVVVLLTSINYGSKVSEPKVILNNTKNALDSLDKKVTEIWMPKINSGLFKVPWEDTEKILNKFPSITFNVCSKE